jgi:GntR family transcriptional regulator
LKAAFRKLRQTTCLMTSSFAARLLHIPLNSPKVRRVFTAKDRTVIYLGEVTYRGDFVRIDMDLRP